MPDSPAPTISTSTCSLAIAPYWRRASGLAIRFLVRFLAKYCQMRTGVRLGSGDLTPVAKFKLRLAPEQRQKQNDRQRNPDQPEQGTFSERHTSLLSCVMAGKRRGWGVVPKTNVIPGRAIRANLRDGRSIIARFRIAACAASGMTVRLISTDNDRS